MILQAITKNYTQAIVSTVVVGLLLWLDVFIVADVVNPVQHQAVGFQLIDGLVSEIPFLPGILALILLFFQSFALAGFSGRFNLLGRTNMMPALLFIILSAFNHHSTLLNPVVLSSTLLVLLLHITGKIGEKTEAAKDTFDAGLVVALASMFYVPSLIFFLFIWFTLISYRMFSWRDWIASIMGLTLPYILLATIYFLTDQLPARVDEFTSVFTFSSFDVIHMDASDIIFFSCVMLPFIPAIIRFLSTRSEKTVYIRRVTSVVLNYLITVLILMIFVRDFYNVALTLLFFPMALIISDFLPTIKKSFFREFFFLLIIGVVIASKLM